MMRTKLDKLIDIVGMNESAGDYARWNPDDNGAGVSFGLIQFNQQQGGLRELFRQMRQADRCQFDATFGAVSVAMPAMLATGFLKSLDLNEPTLKAAIISTAYGQVFRAVQRKVAHEQYLAPAIAIGRTHGITTERGLCLLFDACVQRGEGWVGANVEDVTTSASMSGRPVNDLLAEIARRADAGYGGEEKGRRHKILRSSDLADDVPAMAFPPLAPGDKGEFVPVLIRFIEELENDPIINPDGDVYGPSAQRWVRRFQQNNALTVDAKVGPITWSVLEAAVSAASKR